MTPIAGRRVRASPASGPLVSAAFGGLLWVAADRCSQAGAAAACRSRPSAGWPVINVVLAVFNLLPAAPLDGGGSCTPLVWAVDPRPLAGHPGRDQRRHRPRGRAMVRLGFLVLAAGRPIPIDGLFISFIGWWLLGSARAERQLGQVRHVPRRGADLRGHATGRRRPGLDHRPGLRRALRQRPARAGSGCSRAGTAATAGSCSATRSARCPSPQWDLARPLDVAVPISATTGAGPDEDALEVVSRTGGKQVILVVDGGQHRRRRAAHRLEALVPGGPAEVRYHRVVGMTDPGRPVDLG